MLEEGPADGGVVDDPRRGVEAVGGGRRRSADGPGLDRWTEPGALTWTSALLLSAGRQIRRPTLFYRVP